MGVQIRAIPRWRTVDRRACRRAVVLVPVPVRCLVVAEFVGSLSPAHPVDPC